MHNRRKKGAGKARHRRGATMVEFAIIIIVFLTLVLGMLDLGLAVFRSHVVSYAARQGARQAIVHGEFADKLGPWGPTTFTGTGATDNPISDAVEPYLVGIDPADVVVKAEWIDGGNKLEQRVRIDVTTTYSPTITFVFGNPTWTLTGSSTMPIAH
jgi:Flp pilus assembly protein TadG